MPAAFLAYDRWVEQSRKYRGYRTTTDKRTEELRRKEYENSAEYKNIQKAKSYFESLPVKTKYYKGLVENDLFKFTRNYQSVYELSYKTAIVQMLSNEDVYEIMCFDPEFGYTYKTVSKNEFVNLGGKLPSLWKRLFG